MLTSAVQHAHNDTAASVKVCKPHFRRKHKVLLVCSKLKAEMSSMQPELAARGSTAVQSIEIAVNSLMTSSFCFY